jgi:hypothetical protein
MNNAKQHVVEITAVARKGFRKFSGGTQSIGTETMRKSQKQRKSAEFIDVLAGMMFFMAVTVGSDTIRRDL